MGFDFTVAIVRWLHIVFGITWIGLLYYFNFVQAAAFPKMEAPARNNAFTTLVPRALLFFRWAAMGTFLMGIVMLAMYGSTVYRGAPGRASLIYVGALMGTIMMINVWGIIWPNQKRIIEAIGATVSSGAAAPPDQPKWTRRAFLASRTNTLLSIPMAFFMVAAPFLFQYVAK